MDRVRLEEPISDSKLGEMSPGKLAVMPGSRLALLCWAFQGRTEALCVEFSRWGPVDGFGMLGFYLVQAWFSGVCAVFIVG